MLKLFIRILDNISYIVTGSWPKSSLPMHDKTMTIQRLIVLLHQIAQIKERQEELWLEQEIAKEQARAGESPAPGHETLPAEFPEDETALALPETLRLEVNRLNFPIFVLDDKDVKRRKAIEYRAVIERNGQKLEVGWQVRGDTVFGLSGPFEKKLDLAIQQHINEMTPPIQNPIALSTFALCKRMGERPGGYVYTRIHQSLQRLVGTTITSEGIFYSKGRKEWVSDTFHIYDRVVLRGKTLPDGRIADKNYIWLSGFFLDNINHGYTKPLSLPLYKKLHSPIAQRLYEFLGVKFYGVLNRNGRTFNINYQELCKLLPLKPQKLLRKAKYQLKKAHEELISQGYLEKVEWDNWVIHYYPGPKAKQEHEESQKAQSPFRLNLPQDDEQEFKIKLLVQELQEKLRLDTAYAYHISRRVPHDIIRGCMTDAWLDWRAGKVKNPAAYFTTLLKESCEQRGIQLDLKSSQPKTQEG